MHVEYTSMPDMLLVLSANLVFVLLSNSYIIFICVTVLFS